MLVDVKLQLLQLKVGLPLRTTLSALVFLSKDFLAAPLLDGALLGEVLLRLVSGLSSGDFDWLPRTVWSAGSGILLTFSQALALTPVWTLSVLF